MKISAVLMLVVAAVIPGVTGAAVVYVDRDVAASGSGSTWAAAKKTIAEGIAAAAAFDEIWVKGGRYVETLTIKDKIGLYGGFAGTESQRTQRDYVSNRTIIDANGADAITVNFPAFPQLTNVTFDGFDVTGANKTTTGSGGGVSFNSTFGGVAMRNCRIYGNTNAGGSGGVSVIAATVIIENCIITGNTAGSSGNGGGGVGIGVSNHQPVFRNCVISGNTALGGYGGGGVLCFVATPTFEDCVIANNKAQAGGGINLQGQATATFRRCSISGNMATLFGGGISASASVPQTYENCIISGNSSNTGAGAYYQGGSPAFRNCTISGNTGSAGSSALYLNSGTSFDVRNCIFEGNSSYAIREGSASVDPVVTACNFFGNGGDYLDEGTTGLNGAAAINALAGNSGNISGNPFFAHSGNWQTVATISSKTYDAARRETTINLTAPVLRPGALVNRLVNPNTAQRRETVVYSNTASQLIVSDADGTIQSLATGGANTLRISDYGLTPGSAGVDVATSISAPAKDIEGDNRPVNIFGVGNESSTDSYDVGADEISQTLPAACSGGATVDAPKNGTSVSGNRVTVRAGFASPACLALVQQVQFEYRAVGHSAWTVLPGTASQPNPDTRQPFFTHWDVSGLAPGSYEVRAVAVLDNVVDPDPEAITITVGGNARTVHRINASGETEAESEALVSTETVIAVGDLTAKSLVEVTIPDGALTGDTTLTATLRNPSAFSGTLGAVPHVSAFIDLTLSNGQSQFENGTSATLVFEYADANDDGVVDGTAVNQGVLQIHHLDNGHWRPVPGSAVDPQRKRVTATTTHFSTYGLLGGTLPVSLSAYEVE